MTGKQLTLDIDNVTTELDELRKQSFLGLRPKPITTKAAQEAGIPTSALRKAKKQAFLDYELPHRGGKVRIEFVGQANHKDFWRVWEYE